MWKSIEDDQRKAKGWWCSVGEPDQASDAALFQDLGNSPATLEPPDGLTFSVAFKGQDVQIVDAVQAYIQAVLPGTICWIELPPEDVPDAIKYCGTRSKDPRALGGGVCW